MWSTTSGEPRRSPLMTSMSVTFVLFSNINHHQWCFGLLAKQLVAKNIFQVPATELPDPEADNANPGDSLRQQVDKKKIMLHHTK